MHINTSDVFLCKKSPIMNISARATINPKQDNEEHNNLQYALPKYIREKNNILNNKNIQSLSAAALPSLENV
jgi:hypothetical protein